MLLLSFSMPRIYVATCQARGLALSRMGRWQNSQNAYFLENYIENEWMTRNVVTSEADTLMYVTIKVIITKFDDNNIYSL
jgi:hypothetical protein